MLKIILVKHNEMASHAYNTMWKEILIKYLKKKNKRNNDTVRNKFIRNFEKQFSAENKWIMLLHGELWESL